MNKRETINTAIDMRLSGCLLSEISRTLKVSRGTLNRWFKNIDLPSITKELLSIRQKGKTGEAIKALSKTKHDAFIREADNEWVDLKNNPDFMLGLGLYIGEGSKTCNSVCFSNSNPGAHFIFLRFLSILGYNPSDVTCRLQIYDDHTEETVKKWWSEKLSISVDSFRKTSFSVSRSSTGKRKNMLPYGTLYIKLKKCTRAAIKIARWSELAVL